MTATCEAGELGVVGGWGMGSWGSWDTKSWVGVGAESAELGGGGLGLRAKLETWRLSSVGWTVGGLHPTPPCLQLPHTLYFLVSVWVSTSEETQPGWPNACAGLGFGGLSIQNGGRREA